MKIFKKLLVPVLAILLSVIALPINCTAVSAKSYILINADTLEVLEASNAHLRLPMASTTKIMTALILAELNTPEKEITVTEQMVTVEGSSMGLLSGDTVSYYELLVGMLLPSGNDAANTAAYAVAGSLEKFANLMNKRANEIGMKNTHFVTPSGLDDSEHYSTAYDMALLGAEALKNDTIREIVSQEKITVTFGNPPYQRTLYNHNKLLGRYDCCIGIKTGYTKKSGRCLVSAAEKDGCRVVAVTLNASDDWNIHESLLENGLNRLESTNVTADFSYTSVPVVGGALNSASVGVPSFSCGLTEYGADGISYKVYFKPFLYAPVEVGAVAGTVEYYYNGLLIHKDSIITLQSVEQKTPEYSATAMFSDYFIKIFKYFL